MKARFICYVIWLLWFLSVFTFAQAPAYLRYYPLHVGDRWEYEIRNWEAGPDPVISLSSRQVISDSLMPNGWLYFKIREDGDYVFERVDTLLLEVFRYEKNTCANDERNIYSLHYLPDSTINWTTCDGWTKQVSFCDSGAFGAATFIRHYMDFLFLEESYLEENWGLSNEFGGEGNYYEKVLIYAKVNGAERGVSALDRSFSASPRRYQVLQNYPNPFNNRTTIFFGADNGGNISLTIYNPLGQVVDVLTDQYWPAGQRWLCWNAEAFSSGVYLLAMQTESASLSRKIILLR